MTRRLLPDTSKSGFTLLELLVTLSLMGLMTGLVTGSWMGIRQWMMKQESSLAFNELEQAMRLYRMDHGEWPFARSGKEAKITAPADTRLALLDGYLEGAAVETLLGEAGKASELRILVDHDGDNWIEGEAVKGGSTELPERIRGAVVLYTVDNRGRVVGVSWDQNGGG